MITVLRLHRLRLALTAPLATARGAIRERTVWLVEARSEGAVGWGEAAPLPGFGGEHPEHAELALARACLRGDAEGMAATPCAQAAVADAILDLSLRLAGRGMSEGGPVACNALAGDDAAALAGPAVVKIKAGRDPVAEAARVRALVARRGELRGRLRVDANAAWDEAGAMAFARLAGDLVDYVEQPLAADDLAGHARLRAAGARIALDESIRGPDDVARAVAAQACDAVVLKPNWLGGSHAAGRVAAMARIAGIRVVFSSALGSAVERAVTAHLARLWSPDEAHGLATGRLLERDVADLPMRDPWTIDLPAGPGLGIAVQPW